MRLSARVVVIFLIFLPGYCSAVEVSGPVWGHWVVENSPYNVVAEVRVPPESSLVIDPGVVVNFKGHYKFIVDTAAVLLAVGNEVDSIYFVAEDSTSGWHGIRFLHADGASELSYCVLRYGRASGTAPDNNGGAVLCHYSSPTISNCSIVGNYALENGFGGGVYCYYSASQITACDISYNKASPVGGGIYAIYSDLTLTGNRFASNMAWGAGGGVYCASSNLTASSNSFTDNWSYYGGGIYCFSCELQAGDNSFSGNWVCHLGGGIYVGNTSGVIEGNSFTGNNAEHGGGLYCSYGSTVTIIHNLISSNMTYYADNDGGGIYSHNSSPQILYNVIAANFASRYGGAICLWGSSPIIERNTLTRNTSRYGGGICFHDSCFVTLKNNILWGDSAEVGRELCLLQGETTSPCLTVTYSDVEGGETEVYIDPGAELNWEYGNIDLDPLFVDPTTEDFHLLPNSPCIDVGDPHLEDNDHSRSDMGALPFFHQIALRIRPDDPMPLVFQPGSDVYGMRSIANNATSSRTVTLWSAITNLPGDTLRYLDSWEGNLPGELLRQHHGHIHIPGYVPPGFYNHVMVAQDAVTGEVCHTAVTPFEVSEGQAMPGSASEWFSSFGGEFCSQEEIATAASEVAIDSRCYPNPFNTTTAISYWLPARAYVKLEIYNLLGQKVATLVDRDQQPGAKSVTWEAWGLPSGCYFYRLRSGTETHTRTMVLIK